MVKLPPVATNVPPVGALYQLIVPILAVACNVTLPSPHLLAGVVEVITGISLIVAVTDVLTSDVQTPLVASAKYDVVADKLGVVKLEPVPTKVPPTGASYQFTVPDEKVADKVTEPFPHLEAEVDDVFVGLLVTVTSTGVLTDEQLPSIA